MNGMKAIVVGIAIIASSVFSSGAAAATRVSCGKVLKHSVRLRADLTCPANGLIIGRSGITINLNGHTITGP